jgi:hypothetical protein
VSWRSAQLGQLRSRSKGKGHTVVPTVTEEWEDSIAIATTRSRQILIILHNHLGDEHKPDARNQPNNTRIPPSLKKQTNIKSGFLRLLMPCRAPPTYYVEGSVADGSNGKPAFTRGGIFDVTLGRASVAEAGKGAKGDVVSTNDPRHGTCWPSLSGTPAGHIACA